MLRQLVPLVLAAVLNAGCSLGSTYACGVDADCLDGNRSGVCEADSVCSFPDASCPGGQRYGDHSGAKSGECIGGQDTTGNTAAETGGPATGSGATVGSPGGSSGSAEVTTASLDDGETTTSDTTSMASASSEVGSSSGGASTDPFYEPCGSDCPEGNCFLHFSMMYAVCATSCEPECAPFEGAFGEPYPTECGTLGHCMVLCSGQDMCPDGSMCIETFGPTSACLFPYPGAG